MIYNFNLGIGWASSGVEYAQSYRAKMFRNIHAPAKFIFTDMFPGENIEHMTANIGFLDSEIIWLYTAFTDTRIAPVSYSLADFLHSLDTSNYRIEREAKIVRVFFEGEGNFATLYLTAENSDLVHRIERVSRGCLIRKDYYTYCKLYSEYYAPLDNKAHLYQRRFFNEDGSVAYEEIIDDDKVMYQFKDRLLNSKQELVAYYVESLKLTSGDIVIIDRTTDIGQPILQNAYPAKVGIIIHADHFSEGSTNEDTILWNNYYEYAFSQHERIAFYVTATDAQKDLVREQFANYMDARIRLETIPVGSLPCLKYPDVPRKKHSLITASRLATEKHVDWLVEACAMAHKEIPDISLDIYGEGGEMERIQKLIQEFGAEDYIHLMGQKDLTEVYKDYEAYFAGSTSEGFGLTLMEAVGSGLPIVGFDVRYGNQTFIRDGANGFKIPYEEEADQKEKVLLLHRYIVKLFTELDMEACHAASYALAKEYLTEEVEKRWKNLLTSLS